MRMFAGPNGSGKSSLKTLLRPELQGIYLNPDELEKEMRVQGRLDLISFGITEPPAAEILTFLGSSSFLQSAYSVAEINNLKFVEGVLVLNGVKPNAYLASVVTDFLRQKLLQARKTFTFETVMSSPDKLALLTTARECGYRTYLYYVATDDPLINISRVRSRVALGGHDVPEDKIVSRYYRSLDLLLPAIRRTNRAYIFDNSGDQKEKTWLAEITEGKELELKTNEIPAWFSLAILEKLGHPQL